MACRDGCGCSQEARDARTDEWVGTRTPPPASTGRPVARLQAEKAPDADLIEAMAEAMSKSDAHADWSEMSEGDRDELRRDARAALAAVRAHDAKAGA